jgi:hypothetical protein
MERMTTSEWTAANNDAIARLLATAAESAAFRRADPSYYLAHRPEPIRLINSARYLARALELEAIAERAVEPAARQEWRNMATSYRNLAAMLDAQDERGGSPASEVSHENLGDAD